MKQAQEPYAALARYYDAFTDNMNYAGRVEYLYTLLCDAGAPPGCLALDLACGTGTYSYALLERGYDVIGVDASLDMLGIALEKAAQKQLAPPLFLCQRLEALDLYGTVRAAICLTDSLNHLTTPNQVQRFFKRLANFVEPGGVFIFDVNTPYKHEHVLADNTFVYENETAGVFCVWRNRWIPETKSTEIALDLFSREERQSDESGLYQRSAECFVERAYTIEELTRWLNRAGFAVENIFEELTRQPPGPESERVFLIARRK
ncbi:MAG: class I SAM-dependent methyltransferase [Oscillospiraceae bacterium]|nr:class I SAM-dependent methyltransferase [Oscillospiraceae bacterium]